MVIKKYARNIAVLLLNLSLFVCLAPVAQADSADYREYDIESLQALMQSGELSSKQLVQYYLERIDAIDRNGPGLNSVIEINPQALEIAGALDAERRESGPRGPMHGIPVLLKANIDTADEMETTAGSLALKGHHPPADAFVVTQLRKAGAVILGKTNLSEWANFRSTHSSSGWSSVGGQTHNPYDTARNPCGSSSGSAVAVAASLTSVAVGTETNGSVVCPSSINGVVGIKPTLGLVSRSGIIPIAHSQDTAGPMARTVRDAATLLAAMVGADPSDPLGHTFPDPAPDFAGGFSKGAPKGARIGVWRGYSGAGVDERVEDILDRTVVTLMALGAEIVDPVVIDTDGMNQAQHEVLYYEFKADLNAYLEKSGAPIKSLAGLIEFNEVHADTVMPIFGQEDFIEAQGKGPLTDRQYLDALAAAKRISQNGIDHALEANRLDALIAPTRGPAWLTDHINGDMSTGIGSSSLAAIAGYPSITVPAGYVVGLPIGVSFMGGAFSDARLIRLAYAFEQASLVRNPPPVD